MRGFTYIPQVVDDKSMLNGLLEDISLLHGMMQVFRNVLRQQDGTRSLLHTPL